MPDEVPTYAWSVLSDQVSAAALRPTPRSLADILAVWQRAGEVHKRYLPVECEHGGAPAIELVQVSAHDQTLRDGLVVPIAPLAQAVQALAQDEPLRRDFRTWAQRHGVMLHGAVRRTPHQQVQPPGTASPDALAIAFGAPPPPAPLP